MAQRDYTGWEKERLISYIHDLEEERLVLLAVVDAARALVQVPDDMRALPGIEQEPNLAALWGAIVKYDCHDVG